MEMKPVHCCLLLVVVCILFLSITLLEGDEIHPNNLQKVTSCSNLTEAKEMTYTQASQNATRLKRPKIARAIAQEGLGSKGGTFKGYFTGQKSGTPIRCEDLKREAVDCDAYYSTMDGVKRRCGYSDNEYDPKCSHGIACIDCNEDEAECEQKIQKEKECIDAGYQNCEEQKIQIEKECRDTIYQNCEEQCKDGDGYHGFSSCADKEKKLDNFNKNKYISRHIPNFMGTWSDISQKLYNCKEKITDYCKDCDYDLTLDYNNGIKQYIFDTEGKLDYNNGNKQNRCHTCIKGLTTDQLNSVWDICDGGEKDPEGKKQEIIYDINSIIMDNKNCEENDKSPTGWVCSDRYNTPFPPVKLWKK